jgi:hypothetical protein
MSHSKFIHPSFSKETPNKLGNGFEVCENHHHTLIKTESNWWRVAIAQESIDAKTDGKKIFCVRVDNAGDSSLMFGFTPLETFGSERLANFAWNNFDSCGLHIATGFLFYPRTKLQKVIDFEISRSAKEFVIILTISNNGKKKEMQFICDGIESKSSDVTKILKGDRFFPAVSSAFQQQQITTITLNQLEIRTSVVERLLCEENSSNCVEAEPKKENKKEKKVKQVASKKTKKETKPKTTKATKKKEEKKSNNKEKKTKAKK